MLEKLFDCLNVFFSLIVVPRRVSCNHGGPFLVFRGQRGDSQSEHGIFEVTFAELPFPIHVSKQAMGGVLDTSLQILLMVQENRHYDRDSKRFFIFLLLLIGRFWRHRARMGEVMEKRLNVDALLFEPLTITISLLPLRGIFGESVPDETGHLADASGLQLGCTLARQVDADHFEVGGAGRRLHHFGQHCNYYSNWLSIITTLTSNIPS
jgi:hypothetical protein